MHTTVIDDEYVFVHNGDYSGNVRMHSRSNYATEADVLEVPFEILQEFVGRYYIDRAVSALEQLTGKEFLDL